MTETLFFIAGLLSGVGLMILAMRLVQRREMGVPVVGKPVARRLPDLPDAELELRRRVRQATVARGAEAILARAQETGSRVTPEQAREQAARILEEVGFSLMTTVTRVKLRRDLTPMEATVIDLVGPGYTYAQTAQALGIAPRTVRMHCENASQKIPGTVPCLTRVVLWWQGYPIEALFAYAHGRRVGPSHPIDTSEGAECRREHGARVAPSREPRPGATTRHE